ncbi:MAG: beta-hexosaminidase, partial [Pedobacter sp.]
AYAAQRNIEIIPEIDMPGHATAANKAYPQYSGGGTAAYPEFTFNPGREETYGYLTDILKEVRSLFKTDKIHFGADEVSFGAKAWETNEQVKQLMDKHHLKDILEVENYFLKRMADSIYKLDAKVLAWDEALSAKLDKDKTMLFWWRHDKPQQLEKALSNGYSVILCPRLPLYLDFVQDADHKLGRKWTGKFNGLLTIYHFPGTEAFAKNPQVKGLQGNLWTETIYNDKRLDFMLFPRIAAVAAAAWTIQENKNDEIFLKLVKNDLKLYKKQGIYYFDPFNEELPKKLENPDEKDKKDYIDPFATETKLEKPN